jgi:hypothetical protein
MRTTIDIADPVLKQIKRLQKQTGQSLGRLVSDLLARSLADTQASGKAEPEFHWLTAPMAARFDIRDKEALRDAMDKPHR